MRTLIVTKNYKLSKNGGGPVKSIKNLVSSLSSHMNLNILTSAFDEGTINKYDNITEDQWSKDDTSMVKYVSKFSIKEANNEIKNLKPEVIYLNSFFSPSSIVFYFTIPLNKNIKYVIAPRGEFNPNALNIKNKKKSVFLKLIKSLGLLNKVTFHATSIKEEKDIEKIFPRNTIQVIKNLPDISNELTSKKIKNINGFNIVSIGRISKMKNIDFAVKSLQPISDLNINFDLFGPIEDKDYYEKINREINKLPNNINVQFKGQIDNDQVSKILSNYDLYYSPTLGENYGHSIVEAIQNNVPVLISDNTPWKDLERKNVGFDLSLDNIVQFTKVIIQLSKMNDEEYKKKFMGFNRFIEDELEIKQTINDYKNLLSIGEISREK